jgi:hypothetical protein
MPKNRPATGNAISAPTAKRDARRSFLDATTRAQLDRLAHHKGYSVTALIEKLTASAERRVTARLTGRSLKRYYDGE